MIAMMFTFVFLAMGLALVYLVMSTIRGTQLESQEVKAFSVAEAGLEPGCSPSNSIGRKALPILP